jgi:hypothetical protein
MGKEDREIKCFGANATHYYVVIAVGNNDGIGYYKSSGKKLTLLICRCHKKQGFRSDKPASNWMYFSYLVE